MLDLELLRRASVFADLTDAERDGMRAEREQQEPDGLILESVDASAGFTDEQVAALISQEARNLVIGFEVSDQRTYERRYVKPEWPLGASGITIGIGYDLGYATATEITNHWKGLLSEPDIAMLCRGAGIRGTAARDALPAFMAIRVPYDAALDVFQRKDIPRFGRLALNVFPNSAELAGHAFGALVSLVFNRGAAMKDNKPGDRAEMRKIRDLTAARQFDQVPGQFRAMKRVWQGTGQSGLLKRRDTEALYFERGLQVMKSATALAVASAAAAATPGPVKTSLESLGAAGAAVPIPAPVIDLAMLDGDGRFEHDGVLESLESVDESLWKQVTWSKDADSPDYSHLTDRSLSGQTFDFGPAELELLIAANDFAPDRTYGRIIFALRGCELVTSREHPSTMSSQEGRPVLTLRDVRPNHHTQCCVIGVYNTATHDTRIMSGYTSSTVPCRRAVATYKTTKSLGNMMPTGRYPFEIGWHHAGDDAKKIPGCLVENSPKKTRQKAVFRSVNNLAYDTADIWENAPLHGDNLHPASQDRSATFSSWGCLVVNGTYEAGADREHGTHKGEWALFRAALGLAPTGKTDHGKEFDVVLLTGLEGAIANKLVASNMAGNTDAIQQSLRRLRQGSVGERVKRLQRGLKLPETGNFDHTVAKAFAERQRTDGLPVDGIYSPVLDTRFRFNVFTEPDAIAVAMASTPKLESIGGVTSQFESALDRPKDNLESLYYEIGMLSEAARNQGATSVHENRLESLESISLSRSFADFKDIGMGYLSQFEAPLKAAICANCGPGGAPAAASRDPLSVDGLASFGVAAIRTLLLGKLGLIAFLLPQPLIERIIDVVMETVVKPTVAAAGSQANMTTAALCGAWDKSLAARGGAPVGAPVKSPPARVPPAESAPALVPTAVQPVTAAPGDKVATLLGQMEQAAPPGAPADNAALRHYIKDLRDHLSATGSQLAPDQSKRLLDLLCDSPLVAQLPGAMGHDPYELIGDLEAACKDRPIDPKNKQRLLDDLRSALGDPRVEVRPDVMTRALKALRNARQFDDLAALADRFATRDPDKAFGTVANSYAQGLIDSGRVVAGIHLLKGAIASKTLSETDAIDADGILGRAFKQVYVNHVRTPADAVAVGPMFAGQLKSAFESYGKRYDAQRPGENFYHGINMIAILQRAKRDGIKVEGAPDPEELARGMIAALEPKAALADDPWVLSSLAEAYMAIGDFDKGAQYMGRYANDPRINAFHLTGTVRQLEEVWQLKAGTTGAGAILTNLKARLASMDGGFVTLRPEERRSLANPEVKSIQYQHHFESKVDGGKTLNFVVLQRAYMASACVTAIQRDMGQTGRTIGTGFLVKGSEFSSTLSDDKSYVLTNAHVMWDRAQGAPATDDDGSALSPVEARIIFESDQDMGLTEVYKVARVVWQSPISLHDATLIELDRKVANVRPIEVAPQGMPLIVATGDSKGTRLSVVGHANGGDLVLGMLGTIEDAQATLVDKGPRGNSVDPTYLHYKTPTEPGNSGSPVLEMETWRVVGLHHAGYAPNGNPRLGGKPGINMANEGISIESIRAAVDAALNPPPEPPGPKKGFFRRSS